MNKFLKASAATVALIAGAGAAMADCGIEEGSVRILSNDFDALHVIATAAETCASDTVEVTKNQTTEHKNIQVPALTTNPASYTVAVIATNSIMPLLSADLVRPLDEYIEKWGQDLQEQQLIRIDGNVVAIAFMANAQHLFYREDILSENGIEVPTTYDEIIAAAKTLRDNGVMENPIAAGYKPGWDLAAEFVNTYLATGGEFFKDGTAEVDINNENGLKTLEALKAMSEYMSPDFVTYDSNAMYPLWEAGDTAIQIQWGSRTRQYADAEGPAPEVANVTRFAASPTLDGGTIPAAALWWDGFVIAKNISDEDAEASFRAMMVGISPETVAENQEAAVWLVAGYEPTPAAIGVAADLEAGARPYPMLPYMGLLHTALGDNLAEFMQGQESAEQALSDVSAAYMTAATEAGFIK
ncbi:ABC transporter substrate-binding protein [Paracoccus tegillarcae]|uniref:Sugar ABC transporter substrate-binding protein n=1 Tax=Paracoccus tegillarcae TaxID=1529068 RepID=A0A2K9EH06_9RHOB|nr:extracellular solute-binding protein [Paracoccus tegillarcae]AUH34258.1 sugar ABC transporter substrate-binding protein [Paracoccus tegillarcae]